MKSHKADNYDNFENCLRENIFPLNISRKIDRNISDHPNKHAK